MSMGLMELEADRMGRPKKSDSTERKRNDAPAKIDAALLGKVRIICNVRNTSIAEYLSGVIAPVVAKDFADALKVLNKESDKPRR